MSQRLCTTPRDDVLPGGDRPLPSLFLVITDRDTGQIGSSHLDDPHGTGLSRPSMRQRHDVVDAVWVESSPLVAAELLVA
jgi:hypothetical protein